MSSLKLRPKETSASVSLCGDGCLEQHKNGWIAQHVGIAGSVRDRREGTFRARVGAQSRNDGSAENGAAGCCDPGSKAVERSVTKRLFAAGDLATELVRAPEQKGLLLALEGSSAPDVANLRGQATVGPGAGYRIIGCGPQGRHLVVAHEQRLLDTVEGGPKLRDVPTDHGLPVQEAPGQGSGTMRGP